MGDTAATDADRLISPREMRRIIWASSAGSLVEWYDFFIFGSLAVVMADKFYATASPLIAWLAAFAIGFVVRPFGAVIFGRIGDLTGRKYTFLVTMTLMGICTFAVGCLPTIDRIGPSAGVILIFLRVVQGLALGGEYGGAATYIAEHAPHEKRGYYTSWMQATATGGLFMSLGVILATRLLVGDASFHEWGWRIPFLLSVLLVIVSLYIRVSLRETPLFAKLKASGGVSPNPIVESFGRKANLRLVLLALFGATMGQGVVWYTGQFYALLFLQDTLGVDRMHPNHSIYIVGGALLCAAPLFVVMGSLSDRIGRKPLMMGGMAAAVLTYYPLYGLMSAFAPADTGQHFLFAYQGYNPFALWFCVFVQVVWATMVYGPLAAFLVELFPTRIRYSSLSLPYHIGNGVFGGLVTIIGMWLVARTGDNFSGLWWPMSIAAVSFVVGTAFIREPRRAGGHAAGPQAPTVRAAPDVAENVTADEL